MNLLQRLVKLEKVRTPQGKKYKYMCVIFEGDTDAYQDARGYKVQPFAPQFGGPGGDPFYFATREELDAFGMRADVDLNTVIIEYVTSSNAPEPSTP